MPKWQAPCNLQILAGTDCDWSILNTLGTLLLKSLPWPLACLQNLFATRFQLTSLQLQQMQRPKSSPPGLIDISALKSWVDSYAYLLLLSMWLYLHRNRTIWAAKKKSRTSMSTFGIQHLMVWRTSDSLRGFILPGKFRKGWLLTIRNSMYIIFRSAISGCINHVRFL